MLVRTLILTLSSYVFLQGCTRTSINRDVVSDINPVITEIKIESELLLNCSNPVNKPQTRIVGDVLIAWQNDRNRLRECRRYNADKIKLIEELVNTPSK